MRLEIRRLQRRLGITSLYVTHDQSEAMSLSDRIVVMNAGKVEQAAPPDEIYQRPASIFVADFIGRANFLDAEVLHAGDGTAHVRVLNRAMDVPSHPEVRTGESAQLLVRPESMRLSRVDSASAHHDVSGDHGRVLAAVFYGEVVEYEVETEHGTVVVIDPDPDTGAIHAEGSEVRISFATTKTWLLPE